MPLPWTKDGASHGFGDGDALPWLPQPHGWGDLAVSEQADRPDSMLTLYRAALARRRTDPDLRIGRLQWVEAGEHVIAFRRGDRLLSLTNLGSEPMALPDHHGIVLSSTPLVHGALPSDCTVWLDVEPGAHSA
ncbi:hypothetical protein GCM10025876_22230 [Demequina litorisediminis]|uniref:DUF3459 domain-containing protein n=1 Tax=Demequina litorisediminis TaxID=1849022 RepID=A0ABQ6IE81_9MICO|nr:hypothetical protein GCM10025876_22230 [Demequina litorisediminis]